DAEDVPVLDAVLDVEAQHAERGTEGIACLETIRDQKQVGSVFPGRIRLRPVDADRGAQIHAVDEPMLQGDISLQWRESVPSRLLAVCGCLPRFAEDDADAAAR